MTVGKQIWAELITVEPAVEVVGEDSYPYLKLQRDLFDRNKYPSLLVQEMLWKRGYDAPDYYAFELNNNKLINVAMTEDIIICHLNGPTIIAVRNDVKASMQAIINAVNRTQILPQRDNSRL